MADQMNPTPRKNRGIGTLADLLTSADQFARKPFGYDNPPAAYLSDFLGVPQVARTLDRISYGEPLTTGAGMTTAMRPDTADAAMAVAPIAAKFPRATLGAAGMLAGAADTGAARAAFMGTAPRSEALAIAQRNAAKPVSEGGLGLRPDNTPMERAQAMGFEDGWFHGTTSEAPIEEMRLGVGTLGDSVYATSNPAAAGMYPRLHNMRRQRAGEEMLPESIYPVMVNRGETLQLSMLPAGKFDASKLAGNGFDSVRYNNELGIQEPSRIRSRFAAFDPARFNERDILGGASPEFLAALAAASGGGAVAANYKRKQSK